MKKNGFTLIELLAVIVILAVIALIATPIVLNIIEKARKSAFLDSAYGIESSARVVYMEQILEDGLVEDKVFTFDDEKPDGLNYSGSDPKGGTVIVGANGTTALALHNGRWCAKKSATDKNIIIEDYKEGNCTVEGDTANPGNSGSTGTTGKTADEIMNENPGTSGTIITDPGNNKRFAGGNPNNYVSYGGYIWRIIGTFDGQMKLIYWGTKTRVGPIYTTETFGSNNDWNQAQLKTTLNSTFYDTLTDKTLIDTTYSWNIGGTTSAAPTRIQFYEAERSSTISSVMSKATWEGAIGLMYPSDFGYATSVAASSCDTLRMDYYSSSMCGQEIYNWLAGWSDFRQPTLTPMTSNGTNMFQLTNQDKIDATTVNLAAYEYRPVLYLKKDARVMEGDGTIENSYVIGK